MKVRPEQLIQERILLVEGDQLARRDTAAALERMGFCVAAAGDGDDAVQRITRESFDLVVLDVALPAMEGSRVCHRLRQCTQLPIVMLSARSDESEVVAALETGADDYVTKPFRPRELLARLRAVLRRAERHVQAPVLQAGELEIDIAAMRVTVRGNPVELTATEFRLLVELARRPGRVLSRERLLRSVWGFEFLGDSRLVDMAVKRLRDKIEDEARHPRYIGTVRGAGYRFEAAALAACAG